jgi:hypothetical protein
MRRLLSILVTFLLLCPFPAQCWWEEGHQVIARLAAKHLTPSALLKVSELLDVENTPEAVANAMATASIWADQIKGDTGTAQWHFIDLAWQDSRANIPERCPEDECATAQVRLFAAQLKAADPDSDSRFSDQDALRFLIHFVGDIHQPLHASSDADQGGNCEVLNTAVGEAKNVHALWDGPLVSQLGEDDTALAAELESEIEALPDDEKAADSTGDQDDWAWESHRLAVASIYKKLQIPKEDLAFPASCSEAPDEIKQLRLEIDDDYLQAMKPVVRGQLIKGALRLAKMLNDILG